MPAVTRITIPIVDDQDDGNGVNPSGAEPDTFNAGNATEHFFQAGRLAGSTFYPAWRFQDVTVPQGSTIDSALIRITVMSVTSPDVVFTLNADDVDDASTQWGNLHLPQNITKTSAETTETWEAQGSDVVKTLTVTTQLQEIVSRPGFAPGNAVAFAGFPTGANGASARSSIRDFGWPTRTAQLEVQYTAAGGIVSEQTATVLVSADQEIAAEVGAEPIAQTVETADDEQDVLTSADVLAECVVSSDQEIDVEVA